MPSLRASLVRRLAALAVVVATALAVAPATASALSIPVTIEEMAAKADAVVVAHIDSRAFRQAPSTAHGRGAIYTDAVAHVEKVLKGSRPASIRLTALGGTVGDLTLVADESPVFTPGERCVLFLDANGDVLDGGQGIVTLTGQHAIALGQTLGVLEGRIARGARGVDRWYDTVHALVSAGAPATADALTPATASVLATGPVIHSILPSGRPAGTGSSVTTGSVITVRGSGFGAYGGSATVVMYRTETQTATGTVLAWSDTSIDVVIPRIAGSGPVTVITADGTLSSGFPYAVGFGASGVRWTSTQLNYRVNVASSGATDTALGMIQTAASTWNGYSPFFKFAYAGSCTTTTTQNAVGAFTMNGYNDVFWWTGFPMGSGILAQNMYWYYTSYNPPTLVESDIMFNTQYPWGDGSGGTWDIQSVVTHEFGHSLSLMDQYGVADRGKMMYGRSGSGTQKRSLSADDVAGLRFCMGGSPAVLGGATFNGGVDDVATTTVPVTASVVGAAQMRFFDGAAFGPWVDYAPSATITLASASEGPQIVRAEYRDASGDAVGSSATMVLDVTPPSGTMVIDGDAAVATTLGVTADSAVDDARGVAGMRFSVDGKANWTAWEPYAATRALYLTPGDGLRTVYGEYRDAAGNVTGLADTITLAAAPADPTGLSAVAASPAPAIALGWVDNAKSETSYVVERSENGGAFALVAIPPAGSVSWTDTFGDVAEASRRWGSTWAYRVRASGPGGDSAYASAPGLRLDTTPPASAIDVVPSGWGASVTFTLSATDGQSGVARREWRVVGSPDFTEYTAPVAFATQGATGIEFRAVDTAGNAEAPQPATLRVDHAGPALTAGAPVVGAAVATLSVTAADPDSGVTAFAYSVDGGATQTASPPSAIGSWSVDVPVALSTLATHTVVCESSDAVGNASTATFTFAAGDIPTTIGIRTAATSARIGSRVVLSGWVTPMSMTGRNVVVWVKKPGRPYYSYSSNRTVYALSGGAAWWYRYTFVPGMAKGTYYFKASAPAPGFSSSAGYATSGSGVVSITLR